MKPNLEITSPAVVAPSGLSSFDQRVFEMLLMTNIVSSETILKNSLYQSYQYLVLLLFLLKNLFFEVWMKDLLAAQRSGRGTAHFWQVDRRLTFDSKAANEKAAMCNTMQHRATL